MTKRQGQLLSALVTGIGVVMASTTANAIDIPTSIDIDELWSPIRDHVKAEGYLEFINPTEYPNLLPNGIPLPSTPPGVIFTEEYTGYTTIPGQDIIEVGDSDTTAGDRADFDWVQENRGCETGGLCGNPLPVNHPGFVGAMGWTIGQTEASPHIDPGTGGAHNHSVDEGVLNGLPVLANDDFDGPFFNVVDVFSVISLGQDSDTDANGIPNPRDQALDYVLDFGNTVTGAFSPGVPVLVWIPGWTPLTGIDDYVARWVPLFPGVYDIVAIEPDNGINDDQITEIDAIKAYLVPAPVSLALFAAGLAGFGLLARRRAGC